MATIQEKNPHKSLVEVRNSIEIVTGCIRKEAAAIANNLTHEQCDAVVKADGDEAKIKQAIQPVKPVVEPVIEKKPEPVKADEKPKQHQK